MRPPGPPNLGWQEIEGQPGSVRQQNKTIGEPISIPKAKEHTRFYVQNVRGLSLGDKGSLTTALEYLKVMQVDHAMFQEHHLDTTKPLVTSGIHKQAI